MRKPPNRNLLWSYLLVDGFARAGLETVCIAPGSRSTPLALAFAEHPDIKEYVLLDERGAGYFALGAALRSGAPTALVCTSGTAAANFFPAIVEANYASVPLIVLTADRPQELRGSGANQTIDQIKLYGDQVRWFVDLPLPEAAPDLKLVRYLLGLGGRTIAKSLGEHPGPVHLNVPFRKPLEPTPVAGDVPDDLWQAILAESDYEHGLIQRGKTQPTIEQHAQFMEILTAAERPLLVCGPRCPGKDFPAAVMRLAMLLGAPILADSLSGLRFKALVNDHVIGAYETFLPTELGKQLDQPDLIVQFGAAPISKSLNTYLAQASSAQRIAISSSGVWMDENYLVQHVYQCDETILCAKVADAFIKDSSSSWLAAWQAAEQTTWDQVETLCAEEWFEGRMVAELADQLPHDSLFYVASSLPIRHLDQFARPRTADIHVFSNRGASGIDGIIASALGVAAGGEHVTLLIGDLAFYHDLNSLLIIQKYDLKLTIILINNDGGGIFQRLPIAEYEPQFTELFLTPHGLEFGPAAELFGLAYRQVETPQAYQEEITSALAKQAAVLIEVRGDAARHEATRQKLAAQLNQSMLKITQQ